MDRKVGAGVPLSLGELGAHLTRCHLQQIYYSILMYPAVWPQYTNVTDRTDKQLCYRIGQRSDSTARAKNVLQTVVQKTYT